MAKRPPGQPRQSESLGCKPSDAKQNAALWDVGMRTSLESMALEGVMEFMFHLLSHLYNPGSEIWEQSRRWKQEVTQRCKVWGGRDLVVGRL